jgi:hypothetical protein
MQRLRYKDKQLMLYRELIPLYDEKDSKHMRLHCKEQSANAVLGINTSLFP